MKTKYRSKIDLWVGILLVAAVIAMLFSALEIIGSGESWWSILLQLTLALGVAIFTLSVLINTNYTISNESIFVRTGPFRSTIPIHEIELIEPSQKAWSSAALSLDRLYIEYDRKEDGSKSEIYISPMDKDRFMRDAADRDQNLIYDGKRVVKDDS